MRKGRGEEAAPTWGSLEGEGYSDRFCLGERMNQWRVQRGSGRMGWERLEVWEGRSAGSKASGTFTWYPSSYTNNFFTIRVQNL